MHKLVNNNGGCYTSCWCFVWGVKSINCTLCIVIPGFAHVFKLGERAVISSSYLWQMITFFMEV